MQLLISAFACLPNYGTEPGNGWNWPVHLAEAGHTVYVLTRTIHKEKIDGYLAERPLTRLHFLYVEVPFAHLFTDQDGVLYYLAWQRCALSRAHKLLKTTKIDIVHHVTYGSIHVPSPLWRLKLPVVFGPVGGGQTSPNSMIEYFGKSKRKEQIRTLFTRVLPFSPFHRHRLSKMSVVLATNRETVRLCRSLGRPDAILSLDTALPEWFLTSKPRTFSVSKQPLRLLWVGRLLPRKAIPLTLDILEKVEAPSTLTIIGDGLEPEVVREMIQIRGLGERVFWKPGRIPWEEVRREYTKHDALLFTSLRDSCAPQLLEAMATGLPVITLDIHGARDLVPDEAGIKIPVHSKEQLLCDASAAVTRYAGMSPLEWNQMSMAGWSFAKTLTWPHRAAFAERLYSKILNGQTTFSRDIQSAHSG
jgi:glycosyltransferase involved in cell wall biosynthesis